MRDPRRMGVALVGATALVSGVSIYLNAYAVKGLPAGPFTGAKNLLVALALAAVVLATRERKVLARLPAKDWGRLALIGLVGGSVPFLLFFQGLGMLAGDPAAGALASFLHKTLFVAVAVLAVAFLGETLDARLVAGAALLVAGAAALVAPSLAALAPAHALILLAVLLWAAEITLSKATLRHLPAGVVALGRMGFGAAFIFAWLALRGEASAVLRFDGAQWAWVALTSMLLLAYVLTFYHGLARIPASSAASVLALGLVVTLALDAAFRDVPFGIDGFVGILLLVAGAATMAWRATLAGPTAREVPARG